MKRPFCASVDGGVLPVLIMTPPRLGARCVQAVQHGVCERERGGEGEGERGRERKGGREEGRKGGREAGAGHGSVCPLTTVSTVAATHTKRRIIRQRYWGAAFDSDELNMYNMGLASS